MESRHDSENAERILYNMRPKELVKKRFSCFTSFFIVNVFLMSSVRFQVEVIKKAYLQGEVEFDDSRKDEDNSEEEEHDAASPRNVGHNIYILAHQVYYPPLPHTLYSPMTCKCIACNIKTALHVICVLVKVGTS